MLEVYGANFQNAETVLGTSVVREHMNFGLQYAAYQNKFDVAERLLEIGADPDTPAIEICYRWYWWHTPLQSAAKHNY